MTSRSSFSAALLVGLVAIACGSTAGRTTFEEAPPTTEQPPETPPPSLGGGERTPSIAVTLKGTVFAPNGKLPIAGALVYITQEAPAAIPEGAYCDECVALPEDSFAVSAADGTFSFATSMPKGTHHIVVQKGQFRRVRKVTVDVDGEIELPEDDTTLPARRDVAKGDDTPRMAILKDSTDFDKIDQSLEKLGIEDIDVFDDRRLLEDPAELAKYHVVFVPCGSRTPPEVTKPAIQNNIRNYVASGGKFYVTDWSYEFVRKPFPGYLSWEAETSELGSAASGGVWEAKAVASDQGLGDWLSATGDATFEVEGNWTTIKAVRTVQGPNPKGEMVDITPKVWVTAQKPGGDRPTTVSFEHQCGRVLFSTYHTEASFGNDLHAQEKALLYVLLEVGVCVGERPQPK